MLRPDGTVDRPALAAIVFADPEKLAALNSITHPAIMEVVSARVEVVRAAEELGWLREPPVVVLDAPLLVEVGGTGMCDLVVVVAASERTQIDRLARDRGMSEEEVRARMARQTPIEEKAALADWLITNEGSMAELEAQVDELWKVIDARRRGEEPDLGGRPPVL